MTNPLKTQPKLEPSKNDSSNRTFVHEILTRIRSRPRFNPSDFGLPDSTDLIREDRNR